MKIYTLMENTPYSKIFAFEHGLSIYVETNSHKLLFDFGQSDTFAENAEKLGVNLEDVDIAFLSHGHYDHGGGLKKFLELNNHAHIYVSRLAFGEYYHGSERYIGLDKNLCDTRRIIVTEDNLVIDEELSLRSCNEMDRLFFTDSAGLTEKVGIDYLPDKFLHEQYLTINEGKRRVILSGCSHKGILNIMEWLKPDVLIGGFHFMNENVSTGKNDTLNKAAEILNKYNTQYYTCHCTGQEQYKYLKKYMGERLHYLSSGQVIDI